MVNVIAATPLLGVDFNATYTGTTTDGADAPFQLGLCMNGQDGKEFIFCQASAALATVASQALCLAIDENFQAAKITKALANVGHIIAVAPQAIIADNDFFWAIINGANLNLKVAVSAAADVALWTTATAGVLDDTSGASHVRVVGITLVVAASSSASAGSTVREVIVKRPFIAGLIA